MACCYPEECGEYAVSPMLVSPCYPTKCCEDPPMCFPCLPRCPKGQLVYCCEKPPKAPSRTPQHRDDCDECCRDYNDRRDRSPPRQRRPRSPPPTRQTSGTAPNCDTCCYPPCKPVKTKYVIPCYRYEDGRIHNQPTVLMRRACEVAVGTRQRRKPFIESSYSADPYNEVRRYHSEDERGNCCYHFERKNAISATCCAGHPHACHQHHHLCHHCHHHHHPCAPCRPCQPCTSSPQCQFVDCVHAQAVDSPCCYYC